MLELRILSGYHRGATLPLGAEALTIGADEDADVVLADPGLAARHARLVPDGGSWVLEALDGAVRGAADNAVLERIALDAGDCARLGAVWIGVCAQDAPWNDPPAVPPDLSPPAPADLPPPSDLAPPVPAAIEADDEAAAPSGAQAAPPEATAAAAIPRRRGRGLRMLLAPVAAVTVMSGAAAYALTTHPEPGIDVPAAAAPAKAEAPLLLSDAQLKAALRKRLEETDLLSRLTLELEPGEWLIRGALDEDETERLRRTLRDFARRHVIAAPLRVRIGSPESMLPFRISQVMSGDDPSIVTDDGRRLYVGDEYRGVRLAAVSGNHLRFTGRHELDVAW